MITIRDLLEYASKNKNVNLDTPILIKEPRALVPIYDATELAMLGGNIVIFGTQVKSEMIKATEPARMVQR